MTSSLRVLEASGVSAIVGKPHANRRQNADNRIFQNLMIDSHCTAQMSTRFLYRLNHPRNKVLLDFPQGILDLMDARSNRFRLATPAWESTPEHRRSKSTQTDALMAVWVHPLPATGRARLPRCGV